MSDLILDLGNSGSWDDVRVYRPNVQIANGQRKLWYNAHDGNVERIGLATYGTNIDLDSDKWTEISAGTCSMSISSDTLIIDESGGGQGSVCLVKSSSYNPPNNVIIETRSKIETVYDNTYGQTHYINFLDTTPFPYTTQNVQFILAEKGSNNIKHQSKNSNVWGSEDVVYSSFPTTETWYRAKAIKKSTGIDWHFLDDNKNTLGSLVGNTDPPVNISYPVAMGSRGTKNIYDWFRVRKYTSTEPTSTTTPAFRGYDKIFTGITNTISATDYVSYSAEPIVSNLVNLTAVPLSGSIDILATDTLIDLDYQNSVLTGLSVNNIDRETNFNNNNSSSIIITPASNSINTSITTWNTSSPYYKKWTETGSGDIDTVHTVGDFEANKYYTVWYTKDGGSKTQFITLQANDSGEITFTYDQGYSDVEFEIEEDETAPASFSLLSPTDNSWASAAQPTLSWNASSDTESGLAKYQLWIDDSLDTDNIATTTTSATLTNALDDGDHTWKIVALDNAGNSATSTETWIIRIDTTAPTITQDTAISSPTNDNTPNYSFHSDEAGSVSYSGGCTSITDTVLIGTTTITLNELSDGTYNCAITVTNSTGKISNSLLIPEFIIDTGEAERSAGSPNSALSAGTTNTTLSLTTNKTATCKYSTTANTDYGSMTAFSTTDNTTHLTAISGLTNGTSYSYYVKCQDTTGNTNSSDYTISFLVNSAGGGGMPFWMLNQINNANKTDGGEEDSSNSDGSENDNDGGNNKADKNSEGNNHFSYSKARLKSLPQEQNSAKELKQKLEERYSKGKIPVHKKYWHTIVNSYIYGNYPITAIIKAIKFGGKTVHPIIPFSAWKKAGDYLEWIGR